MDFNMKSKDSSKEHGMQAICELRSSWRNAPLASQLKTIDDEYHYLLDQGQADRAHYVQKLYAWKSKQATQVSSSIWQVDKRACSLRIWWLLLELNYATCCFQWMNQQVMNSGFQYRKLQKMMLCAIKHHLKQTLTFIHWNVCLVVRFYYFYVWKLSVRSWSLL